MTKAKNKAEILSDIKIKQASAIFGLKLNYEREVNKERLNLNDRKTNNVIKVMTVKNGFDKEGFERKLKYLDASKRR